MPKIPSIFMLLWIIPLFMAGTGVAMEQHLVDVDGEEDVLMGTSSDSLATGTRIFRSNLAEINAFWTQVEKPMDTATLEEFIKANYLEQVELHLAELAKRRRAAMPHLDASAIQAVYLLDILIAADVRRLHIGDYFDDMSPENNRPIAAYTNLYDWFDADFDLLYCGCAGLKSSVSEERIEKATNHIFQALRPTLRAFGHSFDWKENTALSAQHLSAITDLVILRWLLNSSEQMFSSILDVARRELKAAKCSGLERNPSANPFINYVRKFSLN